MIHKFYCDLGQRDPIIVSNGWGAGGYILVQGIDSYPVCIWFSINLIFYLKIIPYRPFLIYCYHIEKLF